MDWQKINKNPLHKDNSDAVKKYIKDIKVVNTKDTIIEFFIKKSRELDILDIGAC